jgi:hypothetical protein
MEDAKKLQYKKHLCVCVCYIYVKIGSDEWAWKICLLQLARCELILL